MTPITLQTLSGVPCWVHMEREPHRALQCLRCGERQGYMVGRKVTHRCGTPRTTWTEDTVAIHMFTNGSDREQWLEGEPVEAPSHWPPTP